MQSQKAVLDASALLAWLQKEPGGDAVFRFLEDYACVMSTVNLAEVVTKVGRASQERGRRIASAISRMGISVESFNAQQAIETGLLESTTRTRGLSLGDRACLTVALELEAVVLTADAAWQKLKLPLEIINIRAQ